MKFFDLVALGLGNLFRRKLRTILTVMGVVIGTASILVMVSIGLGMDRKFDEQMKMFGSLNKIEVHPSYNEKPGGRYSGPSDAVRLNDDVVAQLWQVPNVESVVPVLRINATLMSGKAEGWASFNAIDFNLLPALGIEIKEGRMPERGEVLIGSDVGNGFWIPDSRGGKEAQIDPMNDPLELLVYPRVFVEGWEKRMKMKLVPSGVMANADYNFAGAIFMDINDYRSFRDKYDKRYNEPKLSKKDQKLADKYSNIWVYAKDVDSVEGVIENIKTIGLEGYSNSQWISQTKQTTKMIQGVLGGIGSISLIVAAIGITNTMVMSIYERTKEIGIMKVIGAKVGDIRKLFLFEAAAIGFIGGVVGVALSYGLSAALNSLSASGQQNHAGILGEFFSESYLPPWLALAGVAFAMLIGILAGLYPSIRATKLSVLDAIRSDA